MGLAFSIHRETAATDSENYRALLGFYAYVPGSTDEELEAAVTPESIKSALDDLLNSLLPKALGWEAKRFLYHIGQLDSEEEIDDEIGDEEVHDIEAQLVFVSEKEIKSPTDADVKIFIFDGWPDPQTDDSDAHCISWELFVQFVAPVIADLNRWSCIKLYKKSPQWTFNISFEYTDDCDAVKALI